jgi:membrane protease YdiL (CAAX protease family)
LNALVSLLLVSVMFVSFNAGGTREPTPPAWGLFCAHDVFMSSPSQEFLFRSNLFALMRRGNIKGPVLQIIVSAVTFSFMHVFYKDLPTLIVTLAIGLLWGAIYYKYPNFWGVALSHALVGAVAVKVGVV